MEPAHLMLSCACAFEGLHHSIWRNLGLVTPSERNPLCNPLEQSQIMLRRPHILDEVHACL